MFSKSQDMKAKYSIIFNRKGLKLKTSQQALIQIEIYLKGKRKYFSTGIHVTSDQWNEKRKLIKNHLDADKLNQMVQKRLRELEAFELSYSARPEPFSLKCFDVLKKAQPVKREILSFTEFYKQQMEMERKKLKNIKP